MYNFLQYWRWSYNLKLFLRFSLLSVYGATFELVECFHIRYKVWGIFRQLYENDDWGAKKKYISKLLLVISNRSTFSPISLGQGNTHKLYLFRYVDHTSSTTCICMYWTLDMFSNRVKQAHTKLGWDIVMQIFDQS